MQEDNDSEHSSKSEIMTENKKNQGVAMMQSKSRPQSYWYAHILKVKVIKKNILNRILLHPLAVLQIIVNEKPISDLDIFIKENLNKALIYLYAVLS